MISGEANGLVPGRIKSRSLSIFCLCFSSCVGTEGAGLARSAAKAEGIGAGFGSTADRPKSMSLTTYRIKLLLKLEEELGELGVVMMTFREHRSLCARPKNAM